MTWDNKQIIRKGRERHIFLFDLYLLFSKEVKDASGTVKYAYKNKVMTSELGVTEHIEGDECKFAIWTGRAPMIDFRIVLKANSLETKQTWVKRLREVIQETYFSGTSFAILKSPGKVTNNNSSSNSKNNNLTTSQRYSKDIDEQIIINSNDLDPDISSLASFGSGNTTDSEKVRFIQYYSLDCKVIFAFFIICIHPSSYFLCWCAVFLFIAKHYKFYS